MGCSYETAKQTTRINEICTTTTPKNHLNTITLSNCNNKSQTQYQDIKKNHNNDDCQLVRVQQKKLAINNTTTINTNQVNKTSIATVSKIYNSSKNSNSNSETFCQQESNSFNLESNKYTNWNKSTFPEKSLRGGKNVLALQESCINCYPLDCRKRFCCEQHSYKLQQQTHLVANNEIPIHTRQTLTPLNYIKINNNTSYNSYNYSKNCSNHNNNSYCRCHLSYFYSKHTKNTLRHEQQCATHLCHCSCITKQTSDFAEFATTHSANSHYLQKTFSHARTSLAANAYDLKNNLMELMANCATIAESLTGINTLFFKNYLNNGNVNNSKKHNNKNNNNIDTNTNNNNNHNKSELYRGYSQRKHHLLNKTNHNVTSYSSTTTTTTTSSTFSTPSNLNSSNFNANSSCSLHNAISSNNRCYNNNNDTINISNTISCSSNNNKNSNKRLIKNYNNNNQNCQTSAPTAAFNYIGQNYYNFLRNTINFYTASSVILVLCYLTSTTSATATKSDATSIDKHPIRGIDWTKFDESSSDKEILDLLLEKKRYDKRLLPPVNEI